MVSMALSSLTVLAFLLNLFSTINISECKQSSSVSIYKNFSDSLSRRRRLPYAPAQNLSVPQLIQQNGYPVETHTLNTSDGLLLTLHRIPYGKSCSWAPNKTAVYLQHGLLGSSADWILSGPKRALGYLLADAGYDVWLGNSRGNIYSDGIGFRNTSDSKLWNFSWEELGDLDLSAVIDYVLNNSRQSCLFYVGHAMGSALFFILMSSQPQYNSKIKASFQLAPEFYFIPKNNSGVPQNSLVLEQFTEEGKFLDNFERSDCLRQNGIPQQVCNSLRFLIGGFNSAQSDQSYLQTIYGHQFARTSSKAFYHYVQAEECGELRQFDYGEVANTEIFGCPKPPGYNLTLVTSPTYIYFSNIDPVVGECEIQRLSRNLPNVTKISEVSVYTHQDFVWGLNAKIDIYDDIISQMQRSNSSWSSGAPRCG